MLGILTPASQESCNKPLTREPADAMALTLYLLEWISCGCHELPPSDPDGLSLSGVRKIRGSSTGADKSTIWDALQHHRNCSLFEPLIVTHQFEPGPGRNPLTAKRVGACLGPQLCVWPRLLPTLTRYPDYATTNEEASTLLRCIWTSRPPLSCAHVGPCLQPGLGRHVEGS